MEAVPKIKAGKILRRVFVKQAELKEFENTINARL
jgi:hypothetical protein